jgi:hypothetical protein
MKKFLKLTLTNKRNGEMYEMQFESFVEQATTKSVNLGKLLIEISWLGARPVALRQRFGEDPKSVQKIFQKLAEETYIQIAQLISSSDAKVFSDLCSPFSHLLR